MPRQARKKSETGIYHVMFRGVNREPIFTDDEDNWKFINILKKYKEISGFELYAYCLMGNHLHLLIKEGKEDLAQCFKRIAGKYVYWFNAKYQRSGHLFQDRFRSEPVEDDAYFMTVLRYIHQNPVKAGIARTVEEYPWSSYQEYLGKPNLTDTAQALSMMDLRALVEFHRENGTETCIDIPEERSRITDEEAQRLMSRLAGVENETGFQTLSAEIKSQLLGQLREQGVSLRQIEEMTGETKGVIRRVTKRALGNEEETVIPLYQPPQTREVDITIL